MDPGTDRGPTSGQKEEIKVAFGLGFVQIAGANGIPGIQVEA